MQKITQSIVIWSFMLIAPVFAQMVPEPAATEIWDKEPVKVETGHPGSAPSDAIILDHVKWLSVKGGENPWKIENGVMTVTPGTGDIKQKHLSAMYSCT